MILLRKLLFPFSLLYGWITQFRNFLFDKGILKSYSFDLPIIAVGNLSVGGTGKTPMIEYLITLLSKQYQLATLSRGYKRHSDGFQLADKTATPLSLGDEPFQIHQKFPSIQVAVDADRKNGVEKLLSQKQKPEVILLDDAFQHRRVKAGFYILLTTYDALYVDDFMLPTGNLRESRSGVSRANMIIVTKCPDSISEIAQQNIRKKLGTDKLIFFATISYEESVYSESTSMKVTETKEKSKLLVAGIAKPRSFFSYLQNENDTVLTYPDHHHFTDNDIETIIKQAKNRLIITTEKDYVRLKNRIPTQQLFYLPIKTSFVAEGVNFDKTILNYVGTSTRNR